MEIRGHFRAEPVRGIGSGPRAPRLPQEVGPICAISHTIFSEVLVQDIFLEDEIHFCLEAWPGPNQKQVRQVCGCRPYLASPSVLQVSTWLSSFMSASLLLALCP